MFLATILRTALQNAASDIQRTLLTSPDLSRLLLPPVLYRSAAIALYYGLFALALLFGLNRYLLWRARDIASVTVGVMCSAAIAEFVNVQISPATILPAPVANAATLGIRFALIWLGVILAILLSSGPLLFSWRFAIFSAIAIALAAILGSLLQSVSYSMLLLNGVVILDRSLFWIPLALIALALVNRLRTGLVTLSLTAVTWIGGTCAGADILIAIASPTLRTPIVVALQNAVFFGALGAALAWALRPRQISVPHADA